MLSTAGRYQSLQENLEEKEIVVGNGEGRKKYILDRNPKQVLKDKQKREKVLIRLKEELKNSGVFQAGCHNKTGCRLLAHPTFGRNLKT